VAPMLAYHIKQSSPIYRAAAWTVVTGVGTVVGMRLMYAVLVNLP
jgi:hypothetical protein